MILIIADAVDGHARLVQRRLLEKGASVEIVDAGDFPARTRLSARVGAGGEPRLRMHHTGEAKTLDLGLVETVWFRRWSQPEVAPNMSAEDQDFARRESICLLQSMAVLLRDRFWVNPPTIALASDGGNGKIGHLEMARSLGLDIPPTLATNDPDEARAFIAGCASAAIYKPFRTPIRSRTDEHGDEQPALIFTTKLDEGLLARLDGVVHAPCIFQELVPKRFDLRVIVMGARVFACELHSQVSASSSVDFRRDQGMEHTPHVPHELPREIADKLVALNQQLGIVYGAHDLIVTPEGRYVFLEVNQQGQFLWLEEQAGLPLLENFAELLIQRRPDFVCSAPLHEAMPFPPLDP